MTCPEIRQKIDRFLPEQLSRDERITIYQHLYRCEECCAWIEERFVDNRCSPTTDKEKDEVRDMIEEDLKWLLERN